MFFWDVEFHHPLFYNKHIESTLFWRWLHLVRFNNHRESGSCDACLTDSRNQLLWLTRFLHARWARSADWFTCHVSHAQYVDKCLIIYEVHALSCTINSFPYLTPFALAFFSQTWWDSRVCFRLFLCILDVPSRVCCNQHIDVSCPSTSICESAWLVRMI